MFACLRRVTPSLARSAAFQIPIAVHNILNCNTFKTYTPKITFTDPSPADTHSIVSVSKTFRIPTKSVGRTAIRTCSPTRSDSPSPQLLHPLALGWETGSQDGARDSFANPYSSCALQSRTRYDLRIDASSQMSLSSRRFCAKPRETLCSHSVASPRLSTRRKALANRRGRQRETRPAAHV